MQPREKIEALRALMVDAGLSAFVIPSSDPHIGEYPPERWTSRAWISGFDGSAGTVVVTQKSVGLWTDFRYFLAAEQALAGSPIELFREGEPGVLPFPEWLASELQSGDTVGFDASVVSVATAESLTEKLEAKGIKVLPGADLIDEIWNDRPSLPADPVFEHEERFAGSSRGEKISLLRKRIRELGATDHLIATLDDIAWLLNLRGSDVAYNPIFVAYLGINDDSVTLFIDERKVPDEIERALAAEGIAIRPYNDVISYLQAIDPERCVLFSPDQINVGLEQAIPAECRRIRAVNPTSWMKAKKNTSELDCLADVMVRDGVAMVEFLSWLSGAIASGEELTEISAEQTLREFRARGERFVSESFPTISAYRGHGAIVHYKASKESASRLEQTGLYLLDSGAQYRDGTTDITRTIALGPPTAEQRREFTLVLKAHIALATLRFPAGTTGLAIDAITRQCLWRERLNYGHGTGHGVGFFLNVHEGPQRIASQRSDVALVPGMLLSNEPGLYRADRYGIRIENLVCVEEDATNEFGAFLKFRTMTLCPIDRTLIDGDLLSSPELDWINRYHREVREQLRGRLSSSDAADWLDSACATIDL